MTKLPSDLRGCSYSDTYSYTLTDIETVVRRFTADIVMIAQSSGAVSEAKARDYAHDVEGARQERVPREDRSHLFFSADHLRSGRRNT
jgi:hypothetical protein